MSNIVGFVRELIDEALSAGSGVPCDVYTFKPDDVTALPCIVIDRPSLSLDVQHITYECQVVVVGYRDGKAESQYELDVLASLAVQAITGPELTVVRVDPSTASIAEFTYPSYTITVTCAATACLQETSQ